MERIGWAEIRCPICWSSANAPASSRRSSRKRTAPGKIDKAQVDEAARMALEPFERGRDGENPFAVQHELQEMMQDLVGIVRREEEMEQALEGIAKLKARAAKAGISGNREYNNGWHTALDLDNLLTVSEIIARAALERKESRGAHFRDDYPDKERRVGQTSISAITKAADGGVNVERRPGEANARRVEAGDRGE